MRCWWGRLVLHLRLVRGLSVHDCCRLLAFDIFMGSSLLTRGRFHVTTTYAILRMKGVDVGKLDFLTAGKPLGVEKKEE
jgi:hypothetical protein